jgi:hypothetical protein
MRTLTVMVLALGVGAAAAAQETKPTGGKKLEPPPPVPATRAEGSEETSEQKLAHPEVPPPPSGPLAARSTRRPTTPGVGIAPTDGPLKGVRALSSQAGEMRLLFPDGERTVRPGDRLGTDVVRTIGEGLMVLDRGAIPSVAGGGAVVVVRFDAAGQPRMRVYHVEDPTPVNAPQVR